MRTTIIGVATLGLLLPGMASANIDLTHIPLGDGSVSTTTPSVGYVWSCTAPSQNGGGAQVNVPWIASSSAGYYWDLTKKVNVQGAKTWPNAIYQMSLSNNRRIFTNNDLPIVGTTGNFPIATSDPAYLYDTNPNTITSRYVRFTLPLNPSIATTSCVGMGPIGISTNGVFIFNALDAAGRDAVAHEVLDSCGGHPERTGQYHYHGKSQCLTGASSAETVIGYAFDGFPIANGIKADGTHYVNADLDACHGTTTSIIVDGASKTTYHYVATDEYPYTVGCYRGSLSHGDMTDRDRGDDRGGMMGSSTLGIPPAAPYACLLASSTRLFGRGEEGEHVSILQRFLEGIGFLRMPQGVARGFFGRITEQALSQFQSQSGLFPAGRFGPQTRSIMNKQCPPGIMKRGELPPGLMRNGIDDGDDGQGIRGGPKWMMGTSSTSTLPRRNDRDDRPLY